jgi:hypothetical protein
MISAQKTIPGLMDAWIRAEGSVDHSESLAEKLGLNLKETLMLETHCQGWWWIHWAQWASMTTREDLEELKHLISAFYSIPPMSVVWTESKNAGYLDPRFQKFVNEIIRENSKTNESMADRP